MNAAKFKEHLVDYVCGQCDGPTRAEMDRAVSDNAELAAILEGLRARLAPLEAIRELPVPEDLVDRTWHRIQQLAEAEPAVIPIPLWQRWLSRPELVGLAAAILIAAGVFLPAAYRSHQLAEKQSVAHQLLKRAPGQENVPETANRGIDFPKPTKETTEQAPANQTDGDLAP